MSFKIRCLLHFIMTFSCIYIYSKKQFQVYVCPFCCRHDWSFGKHKSKKQKFLNMYFDSIRICTLKTLVLFRLYRHKMKNIQQYLLIAQNFSVDNSKIWTGYLAFSFNYQQNRRKGILPNRLSDRCRCKNRCSAFSFFCSVLLRSMFDFWKF